MPHTFIWNFDKYETTNYCNNIGFDLQVYLTG